METTSSVVEIESVVDNVIDVSDFIEVIYSYRCKICNAVFDASMSAAKHITSTHVQKCPPFSTASTSSVCGLEQVVEQGALTNLEAIVATDSSLTTLPNGSNRLLCENSSSIDISRTTVPKHDTVVVCMTGESSVMNSCQESVNAQLNGSAVSSVQCSDGSQTPSYSRQMQVMINGVAVWLSIPDEIPVETSCLTRTSQWVANSVAVTTADECVRTGYGESSDAVKLLSVAATSTVLDCDANCEVEPMTGTNTSHLISSLSGAKVVTSESLGTDISRAESSFKEYFLCSKCQMGFVVFEDCRQHMIEQHPELLGASAPQTSDEVQMPLNTVSIGTQAQMYKKPGRKRKAPPAVDVIVVESEENNLVSPAVSEMPTPKKDDGEISSAAVNAVSMLGIGRSSSDASSLGKRRVRPPKALVEDYFISRRKHKKRQLLSPVFNLSCDIKGCTAKFSKPQSLGYHVTCHQGVENGGQSFACPECRTEFSTWKTIRMHLWKMHSIDSDLLKCEVETGSGVCRYRTDSAQKLELHQETHNDAQSYCCRTCGKVFKQRSQLRSHELVHHENKDAGASFAGDKSRECSICKRTFANQKSLKKHIEIVHDKKKPFTCNTCGHESSRKAMLDLHLRTHTGEKPYRCDMCNYMASDHNTLRRHRMRHTGEKPYKCHYCVYSCIQAISLKTHLKNKHPGCEGIYSCDSCQYHTVNKQHWLNHLADHKNNLINNDDSSSVQNNSQMFANDSPHIVIEPQYTTAAALPVQAYVEATVSQGQSSGVKIVELQGVSELQSQGLGGTVFETGKSTEQSIVQLTQLSDGYYVIVNESGQTLMGPVQHPDVAFSEDCTVPISTDVFLQQPGATTVATSPTLHLQNDVVEPATSAPETGLHHILTAINTQQQAVDRNVNDANLKFEKQN